jgi:signal transduction histidine kinase
MSRLPLKIRNIIYLDIFLFLIGIAGIYHLTEKAGFNPVTDLEISTSDNGKLIIENVVSEQLRSFFQSQDTILSVNDYAISSIDELEIVTDSKNVGTLIQVHISRSGTPIIQNITIKNFYSFSYILIAFFVGMVFLSLGLFVLIKKPDDAPANIYHWVTVLVAMIIMTTWGNYNIHPEGLGYVIRAIFNLAYALTPVLFVHFSLIFPRIIWKSYKTIIFPLYAFASFVWIWTTLSFIHAVLPVISIEKVQTYLLGFNINRWFFVGCIIWGVFNIIHSYISSIESDERRKILWLMLGLVVGPLSFIFLWQIPQALGYAALVPEEVILLIASIMPLTFAISIVQYQIMDIDFIVNRSTVYGIVVIFLLTFYALFITIAIVLVDTFTTKSSIIISAIAAIILALMFEPVRRKVQKFVDKKFFRVKYNYRLAQRKFTDEMNVSIDIKSMSIFAIEKLDELLSPQCIGILLKEENRERLKMLAFKNCDHLEDRQIYDLQEVITESSQKILSYEDQIESGIPFKSLDPIGNRSISVIIPIRTQNGSLLGLFFLGKKRSETRYGLEDIDLLKTITTQFGLSIERIRLQNKLLLKQEEAKKLSELNQLQSFFISSVSHDLQTPLTAIRMYVDFLKQRRDINESKKYEYLETISGESDRLSRLINNVLDISRIERGVKNYQFTGINLNDLIKNVMKSVQYQLRQYDFEVHMDLPEDNIHFSGDPDSLDRAITNLISNAVKYSGENKYLSIRLFSINNTIGIEVTDKGVGISPEEQEKIFEIFYRSNDKRIQEIGGAGLGLAIVDHFVKAHNGRIEIESEPGQGSRFTIWLSHQK